MQKIRNALIVIWTLCCSVIVSEARISIGIGLPNVSIGINLPAYPVLARVPGYPVYYAPRVDANYFFYDSMYWVYLDDNWYASTWYNGPWALVDIQAVPLYILRIPVSYYRQPPSYFRGWMPDAPPRWGQHWGHDWEQRHRGWDNWKRSSAPAPAPLPAYQREYGGNRYPRIEQQQKLRSQQYRYQPRDKAVRQHLQQVKQIKPAQEQMKPHTEIPAQRNRNIEPVVRTQRPQETPHARPVQPTGHPAAQPQPQHQQPQHQAPQKRAPEVQEHRNQPPPAVQERKQQPQPAMQQQRQQPAAVPHPQQSPNVQHQEQRGPDKNNDRDRGHEQNKDEDHGRGRDK